MDEPAPRLGLVSGLAVRGRVRITIGRLARIPAPDFRQQAQIFVVL